MLDESMFEDIQEIQENSEYLRAVERKDVCLDMYTNLPPYDACREIESKLEADGCLTFDAIFSEPTGFYFIKCFLIADYAVDKALFVKDVQAYRAMRFESARSRVASLLFQRFVSTEPADHQLFSQHPRSSVFHIIQQNKGGVDDKKNGGGGGNMDTMKGKQAAAAAAALAGGMPAAAGAGAAGTPGATAGVAAASPGAATSAGAAAAPGGVINSDGLAAGAAAGNIDNEAAGYHHHQNHLHPSHDPAASAGNHHHNPDPSAQFSPNSHYHHANAADAGAAPTSAAASSSLPPSSADHHAGVEMTGIIPGPPSSSSLMGVTNGRAPGTAMTTASYPLRSSNLAATFASIHSIPHLANGPQVPLGGAAGGAAAGPSDSAQFGSSSSTVTNTTTSSLPPFPSSSSSSSAHAAGTSMSNAPSYPPSHPVPSSHSSAASTLLQMGAQNNPIGVYGKSVRIVLERVMRGEAPVDLFDDVAREVLDDLKLDVFPRFKQSDFYRRYIRTKWNETQKVTVRDFTTFRVLGRGGFGAVHACRKKNSGYIYAMKSINKKLVKVKSALDNVLEERNVLTMMKSNFVTNLKYALQDEDTLYLIMDLMLGGDLKFHLLNSGRFTEKRARFYAAQVLLGLEHVHKMSIVYRDMKLENVLLDSQGHCRLSDLGLAVVTKVKIKGYAGTPGYTAPEMIKNKLYGTSADIFSYGVMLYRMLCGSKPFKGKVDRDLDRSVIERKPSFPKEVFSRDSTMLLTGLLQKKPENRLGCLGRGCEEIKEHLFFSTIDWGLLEAGYMDPPFVPNKFDVNAASLKDIGDFDRKKYANVRLDDRFKQRVKNFEYVSVRALQDEMVQVLEKADEKIVFEKFAQKVTRAKLSPSRTTNACCVVL